MREAIVLLTACLLFKAAIACNNDYDCNLNGACSKSLCACRPGWTGRDCGMLDLLPAAKNGGYDLSDTSSWGGGVLADGAGGYHMYLAQMQGHCGLGSWLRNSAIVHAVGSSPGGPFIAKDTPMSYFAHNPQPIRAPDGTYLIFHIGCGTDHNPITGCSGGVTPGASLSKHDSNESWKRESSPADEPCWAIRAMSSSSLNGPWQDQFLFFGGNGQNFPAGSDNPSPVFNDDGSIMVMFRSAANNKYLIGIATAPHWKGPYTLPAGPILTNANEDPFFWRDKESKTYHALFHGMEPWCACGRHAFSSDGRTWTLSPTIAFNSTIKWTDGSTSNVGRRERPQLFLDPVSGRPNYLYTGVQPGSTDKTFTLAQPIR